MKLKKIKLHLTDLSRKSFLSIWIIFHTAVLLLFLFSGIIRNFQFSVTADLFNILPKTFEEESINMADSKLTEGSSKNVFILTGRTDFSEAKSAAEKVYAELCKSPFFDSVTLFNDDSTMSEILDYLYLNRWNLLDDSSIEQINTPEGEETFRWDALSKVYSAFTMVPLDNLETDPFLLTETELNSYLAKLQQSGIAMSVKDGVLAQHFENKWYVMIRGVLNKAGAAMASRNNGVTDIYRICESINDGTEFIYSGTPFHSHESSTSASREISIIATISLLIVLVILLFVFRSPLPVFLSMASISISIITAFITTIAVFPKLHMITLVFGTSLIGSCIDYSLHYFIHWSGNKDLSSGKEIRNFLLPGLSMAIISTGICFAILLFAPFTLLKQISLFCLSGLLSSFLTTISIFPYIPLPEKERSIKFLEIRSKRNTSGKFRYVKKLIIPVIFVLSITSCFIFKDNLRIQNNISGLYKMKGKLLQDEIISSKIIQYNPTGWYIVRGNSPEEALENEEELRIKFSELTGGKTGYISTSLFVPSKKKQLESKNACSILLKNVTEQMEYLGFDESSVEKVTVDFENNKDHFITPDILPEVLVDSISNSWLGEINGKYYTVLIPSTLDGDYNFRSLCENDENIFFVQKSKDISTDLDKLTKLILIFFLAAYIVMFFVLKFFYSWKDSFRIVLVPVMIILVTSACFAVLNISLEFFSVTGIILVFGLGLDYIIYMTENKNRNNSQQLEPFATLLSFITTDISFGALALSSFQPVHLIGLAICIGLTTAYLCSISK